MLKEAADHREIARETAGNEDKTSRKRALVRKSVIITLLLAGSALREVEPGLWGTERWLMSFRQWRVQLAV